MKEHRALLPLIEKYREYKKVKNDADGARELMESGESELRELAARNTARIRSASALWRRS